MSKKTNWIEMQSEEVPKRVRPVESVSQFIDLIVKDREVEFTEVVYRGHADASWRTVPSLFRSDVFSKYEHEMGRDLIAHFPQDFQNDATMFDRLVRMQHYGLPTRLVDVTVNPLVALYFACQSVTEQGSEKDAHVVAYRVKASRTKYYDSDTVSILSNLSSLDMEDKRELLAGADNFMAYNQDSFKKASMKVLQLNGCYILSGTRNPTSGALLTLRICIGRST